MLEELSRLIEFDVTVFVVDSGSATDDIRARLAAVLIDDIESESAIIDYLHRPRKCRTMNKRDLSETKHALQGR
jgi:hypothetical protein